MSNKVFTVTVINTLNSLGGIGSGIFKKKKKQVIWKSLDHKLKLKKETIENSRSNKTEYLK